MEKKDEALISPEAQATNGSVKSPEAVKAEDGKADSEKKDTDSAASGDAPTDIVEDSPDKENNKVAQLSEVQSPSETVPAVKDEIVTKKSSDVQQTNQAPVNEVQVTETKLESSTPASSELTTKSPEDSKPKPSATTSEVSKPELPVEVSAEIKPEPAAKTPDEPKPEPVAKTPEETKPEPVPEKIPEAKTESAEVETLEEAKPESSAVEAVVEAPAKSPVDVKPVLAATPEEVKPEPTPVTPPQESMPVPATPEEPKPAPVTPEEPKPAPATPEEPKPAAPATPEEPKPAPATPEEPKPAPATPEEAKPAPTTPEESKPAPTTPEESKTEPSSATPEESVSEQTPTPVEAKTEQETVVAKSVEEVKLSDDALPEESKSSSDKKIEISPVADSLEKESEVVQVNGTTEADQNVTSEPIKESPKEENLVTVNGQVPESMPCEVATVISWKHGGQDVAVCGDFSKWEDKCALNEQDGVFVTKIKLDKGQHHLKFFVDGNWTVDESEPVVELEGHGQVNVLTV